MLCLISGPSSKPLLDFWNLFGTKFTRKSDFFSANCQMLSKPSECIRTCLSMSEHIRKLRKPCKNLAKSREIVEMFAKKIRSKNLRCLLGSTVGRRYLEAPFKKQGGNRRPPEFILVWKFFVVHVSAWRFRRGRFGNWQRNIVLYGNHTLSCVEATQCLVSVSYTHLTLPTKA